MQMLDTNSRLDKMAFARTHFASRGMMQGTTLSYMAMVHRGEAPETPLVPQRADLEQDDNDDLGPVEGPKPVGNGVGNP